MARVEASVCSQSTCKRTDGHYLFVSTHQWLEQGQYNDRGINVVREFKDRGIRVWGARTLQQSQILLEVHQRSSFVHHD